MEDIKSFNCKAVLFTEYIVAFGVIALFFLANLHHSTTSIIGCRYFISPYAVNNFNKVISSLLFSLTVLKQSYLVYLFGKLIVKYILIFLSFYKVVQLMESLT